MLAYVRLLCLKCCREAVLVRSMCWQQVFCVKHCPHACIILSFTALFARLADQLAIAVQTDGWLSQQSAQVYEMSTETLFVGRQDAMQRQTLVPLAEHMRSQQRTSAMAAPRMLEVACGTGRFATFLKVGPCKRIVCISWDVHTEVHVGG